MEQRNSLLLVAVVAIGAITIVLQAADEKEANYTVRVLALPDHDQGTITMDYIAYDPKTGYVWVPAINIGSVDVVDTSNGVRAVSSSSRAYAWPVSAHSANSAKVGSSARAVAMRAHSAGGKTWRGHGRQGSVSASRMMADAVVISPPSH